MKLSNSLRLIVLTVLVTTLGVTNAQAAKISWTTSLSGALATAKKTGKPVLVNFSAKWCPPCQVMDQTTFRDARVISESRKWIMVYIDADKQEKLTERFKIEDYPTILVMKPNGTIVARAKSIKEINTTANFLKWWKPKYSAAKK